MKTRRFCLPALEMLEVRDTPAGTVTGSFANGTWTLIGDAEANHIRINPTVNKNEFEVTGLNTTVAGVVNPSNVQNIVVRLRAGDDRFEVNDTGDLARLLGKLTIAGGGGANYVDVRDLKVAGVTITNGVNITGQDEVHLTNLLVQKNVTINNGDGESYTTLERDAYAAVSRIGGNLNVLHGAGKNETAISDYYIGGDVTVRNGLPDAGNAAGYVEIYYNYRASRSIIVGNVSVSYQGGIADTDELNDIEVFGNVRFDFGSGTGDLEIGAYETYQPSHIHGNLTVLGRGNTNVDIGPADNAIELIVDKILTIQTGPGADQIDIWGLYLRGATRIATGAGNDTITIDESTFIGPTTLRTGSGLDTVRLESKAFTDHGTQFVKPLKIHLGLDNDTLSIGAANDDFPMVELLGLATLDGGAGDDVFNRFNLFSNGGGPITALFETINL